MEKQQTVHLFVFDNMSDWEPAYAVCAINSPEHQLHPGRYRVKTVAEESRPIVTAGGLTLLPNMTLDELDPRESAMLILPGGRLWDDGKNSPAAAKARTMLASGVSVAAIGGATLGLAHAGALDVMRHTSNSPEYLRPSRYLGSALYLEQLAVTDGRLITASSAGALEFACEIFKQLQLYHPARLDTWYGLFKSGNPAYFSAWSGS